MKKTLTIIFLIFNLINYSQELTFKILKKDIQLVNLNGDTISVFEQLLQNKTVIIDISATWCPPCWEFHKSKILDSLYLRSDFYSFLIEADIATPDSSLYGKGNRTKGNWTKTNHPVINLKTKSDLGLEYSYYPTLYMILPDKRYYNISESDYDLNVVKKIVILRNHLLNCYKNPHE